MTDSKLLNELIVESGLKKQFIAEYLGISRYSLHQKINNITEFKVSEVDKLCELLSISSLKKRNLIFFAKKVD